MANFNDTASMALFCDFENIALGVRDAQYEKFDIRPVLERLLAKGSIVVKKAYCDWERYKGFKAGMHEANFELIEIPHVRQSGKNSADIRMVVDALDLCYTKAHVDTFVIISGDSDFSPLVSKLRENAKKVIGVGVKQSCSDLLVTNCDEFIYYDDLVRDRESNRGSQRREREKRSPEEEARRKEKQEERKAKAVDIVHATFADLIADRGESERIWASVLKEVVKRRNPGFNENYFGFRTFGNLLEEAASRNLLGFGRDDKGAFVFRAPARPLNGEADGVGEDSVSVDAVSETSSPESPAGEPPVVVTAEAGEKAPAEGRGNGRRRGGRRAASPRGEAAALVPAADDPAGGQAVAVGVGSEAVDAVPAAEAPVTTVAPEVPPPAPATETAGEKPRRGGRRPRKSEAPVPAAEPVNPPAETAVAADAPAPAESAATDTPPAKAKTSRRSAPRTPRTRKPKAETV